MRKIISLCLTVLFATVIINALMIVAYATEGKANYNQETPISVSEYARNTLPNYMSALNKSGIDIEISQPYPVYSQNGIINGKCIFLVFQKDSMIGLLNVAFGNGDFCSTYEACNYKDVDISLQRKEQIAFYTSNDNFVLLANDTYTILNHAANAISPSINRFNIEKTSITLNKIDIENRLYLSSPATYNIQIDTPYVSNDTVINLNGDSRGLCWAAAVASKVMQAGLSTSSLTAYSVYSKCVREYKSEGGYNASIPQGNTAWIKKAYELYGLTTSAYSSLSATTVVSKLQNDQTIHLRMVDYGNSDNEMATADPIRHSVILYGISGTTQNGGIYFILDSNNNGMILSSYSSGGSAFTYSPSYADHSYSLYKAIY